MLLELLFTRDNVESSVKVAVGVDDVQLTPVLSDFPSTFQDKILCALFRVPDADQLGIIGLAHLLRGNHSISHDNWERLDVTIALSTTGISTAQKTACMMILLLLFLQKQSLAFDVYLFGIGTLLTGLGLKKQHM